MSARFWVQVYGPHTTGAFGPDTYTVLDPDDVNVTDSVVTILTAPREEGYHVTTGERFPARPARLVVYPKGEAHKVVVCGEIQPREGGTS